MNGTTIARWTGRGSLANLKESVLRLLQAEGVTAGVSVIGQSLVIGEADPARVAGLITRMPGVAWLAAGATSNSIKGVAAEVGLLAPKYLRPGTRFVVRAESTRGMHRPSDLAGAGTGFALEAVKGARVSESSPQVVFRIAFDGNRGAAGVQLCEGVGGVPVSSDEANCLVSGGKHSSVLAWAALLSGYSVRLVHAKVDETSLRNVAQLYAELSHRVGPKNLELLVLEGGASKALTRWARSASGPIYVGLHAGCHDGARSVVRSAQAPLFLLTEEWFDSTFSDLGLHPHRAAAGTREGRSGGYSVARVGGAMADIHEVLRLLERSRR